MIAFALLDGVGQAVQQHAALVGRELRPAGGVEGPLGRLDRPIDVVRLPWPPLRPAAARNRDRGCKTVPRRMP